MTDHTEMQIPDELRVELAKDYVRQNFESGEPWSMTIARAILAERERCARIVYAEFSSMSGYLYTDAVVVGKIRSVDK